MNPGNLGMVGKPAPELSATWLSHVDGDSLRLADIDEPFIYLYFFQSWCDGCHSHGFPTMVAVRRELEARGLSDQVRFVAIQTVFEGHETNDEAAATESLKRHGLTDIALGHDSGEPPVQMTNYRTGGTPWTVLIGPDRLVRYDGFHADADQLITLVEAPGADAPDADGVPTAEPVLTLEDQFPTAIPELALEWQADTAPHPELIVFNETLAEELGLDPATLESPAGVATLVGNLPPAGSTPVAMAYAGHQFGNYSPRLGDGRALLLGELVDDEGHRRDLHLKGSGRTPFARGGDGKATIGPMLREFLISEALHALDVPTTRSLAVVTTGESPMRDRPEPGAVLARVAESHIRVGTFEYAARLQADNLVARLADYATLRHHPEVTDDEHPYRAFLDAVVEAQAKLIAHWMLSGFIHGVMNTDNMTISGEGIDYGPCAFMDRFDPTTVFSSIDHAGRYAYGNQPVIATWNLARLAEALIPLLAEIGPADADGKPDASEAIAVATASLDGFATRYDTHWQAGMQTKLGLVGAPSDESLFADLLSVMQSEQLDYTGTFRQLASSLTDDSVVGGAPTALSVWMDRWHTQLAAEGRPDDEVATSMNAVNPLYIPRNHLVDEALNAATDGDLGPFEQLLDVVTQPFEEREGLERFAEPAPEEFNDRFRTFCGT